MLFRSLKFWNDKIILYLSKLSNLHGISIKNPILWFLLLVTIFHCLNVISFNSIQFGFTSIDDFWSITKDNFKYAFAIANPAHRISSIGPDTELTGCNYAVSFFSRLFIGYIYYQFISAFRRFGK